MLKRVLCLLLLLISLIGGAQARGPKPNCSVMVLSGGSIASGYTATPSGGVLCINTGSFNQSAQVTLSKAIAVTGWPQQPPITPDGTTPTYMPALTQVSGFTVFSGQASNVSVRYMAGTGTGKATSGSPATSCGGPQFFSVDSSSLANPLAEFNWLKDFNCAIEFNQGPSNPIANYNFVNGSAYVGIGCVSCIGNVGGTLWTGNLVAHNGYGTYQSGFNSYQYVFSGPGGAPSSDMTLALNRAIDDPQWSNYDTHGGTRIKFLQNLGLFAGHYTSVNMVSASSSGPVNPIVNAQADENVLDAGTSSGVDSIVVCGDSCGSANITGGSIQRNRILFGASNGCLTAQSSVVTVADNNIATPCNSANGTAAETIVSITLNQWADGTPNQYVPNQPNHTIAHINVNMSADWWAWQQPPGTLTLGGANSCGVRIVGSELVQALSTGSPAQKCNDFTITATLTGVAGGPLTQSFSITGDTSSFFVSTSGSDSPSTPGTLAQPFLTLGKCQTAMRASTKQTCQIRGGTYVLPSSGLILTTPQDDGQRWIVYPPDGNGSAIISGAALSPAGSTFALNSTAKAIIVSGLKFVNSSFIQVFSQGDFAQFTNNIFDGGGTNQWFGLDVYGKSILIAGNTFENQALSGGSGSGIGFNSTGFTGVVRDNNFWCEGDFGAQGLGGGLSSTIFARNHVRNIGIVGGGVAPNCTTVVSGAGTGLEILGSGRILFVKNDDTGSTGYSIAYNGTTGRTDAPCYLYGNNLHNAGDPTVLINSGSGCEVSHNTLISPGSIGMNAGEEHDTCPRSGYSNKLWIARNSITPGLESIWVTVSQGSVFQGNVGGIGTATIGNPSPHWPAGISFPNWAAAGGCSVVENSTGNLIQLNVFTSLANNAQYGAYFAPAQSSNTLAYNVLWPFGTPGVAAIQNNSGGTITDTNNQKTASTAPLATAPPIADAGAGDTIFPGQLVTLDASGTSFIPGGPTSAVTYAWKQISGPMVDLSDTDEVRATFVAPQAGQPMILCFQATATTSNGSTSDRTCLGVDPFI